MNGVGLAARFSLPPNRLGLCGPKKIKNTRDRTELATTLKKFRAPYAYLSLIAEANGLKPFDEEVVEAFWIGNRILNGISDDDMAAVIRRRFVGPRILSSARAEALITHLPKQVYPHHAFHVFYIGSISGVLPRTSQAMDLCRVAWGKVRKIDKKGAHVSYAPVNIHNARRHNARLCFARKKDAVWSTDDGLETIEVGDTLASHWKTAATILNRRQEKNLQKYTQINMALFEKRPK